MTVHLSGDNRKCRDCPNVVMHPRGKLCGPCQQAAHVRAVARNNVRAQKVKAARKAGEAPQGMFAQMSGLQASWFPFGMDGGGA